MKLFFLCLLIVGIHSNSYLYEPNRQGVRNQNQRGQENRYMLQQTVGNSVCQFACCFYKEISSRENSGNIFFSPLSISTAFAMLTLGARSDTLTQILRVLSFNPREISENQIHEGYRQLMQMVNRKNEALQLNMGNVLFVLDQLKPQEKFLNNLRNYYEGEAYPMNFKRANQAQMKINEYVAGRTNGKIRDLINNLDPLTEILLISYIYFNGKIYISYSLTSCTISSGQSLTSSPFFAIRFLIGNHILFSFCSHSCLIINKAIRNYCLLNADYNFSKIQGKFSSYIVMYTFLSR